MCYGEGSPYTAVSLLPPVGNFGGRRNGVVAGVLPPVLCCESGRCVPVTGVYAVPANSCVCIGFTLKNRLHNFMDRLHGFGPMPSRSVSAQIVFPVKS